MLEENLYIKIKERRNLLGITQQDLADISGVALRTVKQIESGRGNPSVSTLNKIANVLGLSVDLVVKKVDKA